MQNLSSIYIIIYPLYSNGIFRVHIDTTSMGLPIVYFKGSQVKFSNYDVFLSLKLVLILANSADPDEMQQKIILILANSADPDSSGSSLFSKYLFRGFQYTKLNKQYSKTCVKRTFKNRQNKDLNGSLMKVKISLNIFYFNLVRYTYKYIQVT